MPRRRPPYPAELRRQMVDLVRSGRTLEELSRECEPTAQAIGNRVHQADHDGGVRRDEGLPSARREELSRRRREIRRLRRERDTLAKGGSLVRAEDRHDPVRAFQFMSAHQALFPTATPARVPGVSKSGDYARLGRETSARARAGEALLRRIRTAGAVSRGTCGTPRIHAGRKAGTDAVGRERVARLMRDPALNDVSRRRSPATTRRDREARPAPDLVDRDFTADAPNRLRVSYITFAPTLAGFLYRSPVGRLV